MKYVFIVLCIACLSCANLRITNVWQPKTGINKKFKTILVVSINGENKHFEKQKMELEMVKDLNEMGFNALSAIQEYGPKMFRNISEDSALKLIEGKGVDAVMTIVLLNKIKERYYVPNTIYYSPYVSYQSHFWGYYNTMFMRVYSPGYYAEERDYFFESNLYDMTKKEISISIQTAAFNPSSNEILAHEYSKLILKSLRENGFLVN